MEDTPGDQQTKIESIKSTGSQDGRPSSCTPTYISSGNNSGAKTLIEYDIDESLDIKEEIVHDEEIRQRRNDNRHSGENQPDKKCVTTEISSDNNSDARTLIKYDIDKPLIIKEEIIQDQERHQSEKNNLGTGRNQLDEGHATAASNNNSGARTLIEYDIEEPLDIKEEILADPERHQKIGHCLLSGKNQLDEKCIITEVSCDNIPRPKTLIEYEDDETLEIKEEIIRDQENIEQELDETYESKLCTINTRGADIMTVKQPRKSEKQKLHEPQGKTRKRYKCGRCARSYGQKGTLYTHKKFECGVMPQFCCEFCGKQFKRENNMNRHILSVHQKTNSKASQMWHNCNKCSQIYSTLSALNSHKRSEHAVIKPQFICDDCGYQTKQKQHMSEHITSRHFQKFHLVKPAKKYRCEKCFRTYFQKRNLNIHKKFACGVVTQFSCEFCGKEYKRKNNLNIHIQVLCTHQRTNSKSS